MGVANNNLVGVINYAITVLVDEVNITCLEVGVLLVFFGNTGRILQLTHLACLTCLFI